MGNGGAIETRAAERMHLGGSVNRTDNPSNRTPARVPDLWVHPGFEWVMVLHFREDSIGGEMMEVDSLAGASGWYCDPHLPYGDRSVGVAG
jgi:hypothetical protein